MIIKVTDNFRTFKKDDVFELKFNTDRKNPEENRFLFLIGDNGCGKSTLLKSLRQYKNLHFADIFGVGNGKIEKNINLSAEIIEISKNVNVDYDDYEIIDALDGELDSPSDWGNCSSAGDFVDNGGYYTHKMSNGMKSVSSFIEWVQNSKTKVVPGKTLILLDEIERGWKIDFCLRQTDILNKHFKGCDFVVVSHNPLCCLGVCGNFTFFDVESKQYYDSYKDYFHDKTGMYIDLSYINKENFYTDIISKFKDDIKDLKMKLEAYENKVE